MRNFQKKKKTDESGFTTVRVAAYYGWEDIVGCLLEDYLVDINAKNGDAGRPRKPPKSGSQCDGR